MNPNARRVMKSMGALVFLALFAFDSAGASNHPKHIVGTWKQQWSLMDGSEALFVLELKGDGTFTAKRPGARRGPDEAYRGKWRFQGTEVIFSNVVSSGPSKKIPDLFDTCDHEYRRGDAFFRRYLKCAASSFGPLHDRVPPGRKAKLDDRDVIAMGGFFHAAKQDLPILGWPDSVKHFRKHCRVEKLKQFPFYRQTCGKKMPAGTPFQVVAQLKERPDMYFIRYQYYKLAESTPFPARAYGSGWVRYRFGPTTRVEAVTQDYPFRRPAGAFKADDGFRRDFAGEWRQTTVDGSAYEPMRLRLDANGSFGAGTKRSDGKVYKYRGSWFFHGRHLAFKSTVVPGSAKDYILIDDDKQCLPMVKPQHVLYERWLDCVGYQYFLLRSRVPPGRIKVFNKHRVITLKPEVRITRRRVVPRDLKEYSSTGRFCSVHRPPPPEGGSGRMVCVPYLPKGTSVTVLARTEVKGLYPGKSGHALLVEYRTVTSYTDIIDSTGYGVRRFFVPEDF